MNRYIKIASFSAVTGMIVALAAFSHPSLSTCSSAAGTAPLTKVASGFAVVELFTSEGCSSCPPADAALERIAKEYPANVYVLGFHVDYWDRLGWKDVYSSPDYTHRQQEYAQLFHLNSIYTPQAVVNGRHEFVGSNESSLRSAVEEGLAAASNGRITGSAKLDGGQHVKVSYNVDDPGKGTLQIALVQSQAVSQVLRGENQGQRLQHVNVVRSFQSVSLKSGKEGVADLKIPDGLAARDCKVIAFLQNKEDGRITEAASILF
jgi:hypothetical protein